MKDTLYSVFEKVHSITGTKISLISDITEILHDLSITDIDREISLTSDSRCSILLKVLGNTNPELGTEDLDYITNSILFDKGSIKSLIRINDYANTKISVSSNGKIIKVVVDKITVTNPVNLYNDLVELINELVFALRVDLEISIIIHKLKASVLEVGMTTGITNVNVINIG